MALSQKLAQFNKQQEKLQASLAKITAARPAPAPAAPAKAPASRKAPPAPPSQNTVPFAQRFSFTTEKEKLQQIATIQRAPVGAQIKRVLDLLLETRQSLRPTDINDMCFVDVSANKELFESLKSNVKVSFDGKRFAYKSKHDVKTKAELLVLIRGVPEGIPMGDLKDSYPGVMSDTQELKANGDIWLLMNSDSQEDIAYPNDPRIKIKIEEDLKQLVRSIEMPREFIDIEKELTKAGMKPATNTARREALKGALRTQQTQKKMKKRRETKRTKYTNAHLPELFQNLQESDQLKNLNVGREAGDRLGNDGGPAALDLPFPLLNGTAALAPGPGLPPMVLNGPSLAPVGPLLRSSAPSPPVLPPPAALQPVQFKQLIASLRYNGFTSAAGFLAEYLFFLLLDSTLFVPTNVAFVGVVSFPVVA